MQAFKSRDHILCSPSLLPSNRTKLRYYKFIYSINLTKDSHCRKSYKWIRGISIKIESKIPKIKSLLKLKLCLKTVSIYNPLKNHLFGSLAKLTPLLDFCKYLPNIQNCEIRIKEPTTWKYLLRSRCINKLALFSSGQFIRKPQTKLLKYYQPRLIRYLLSAPCLQYIHLRALHSSDIENLLPIILLAFEKTSTPKALTFSEINPKSIFNKDNLNTGLFEYIQQIYADENDTFFLENHHHFSNLKRLVIEACQGSDCKLIEFPKLKSMASLTTLQIYVKIPNENWFNLFLANFALPKSNKLRNVTLKFGYHPSNYNFDFRDKPTNTTEEIHFIEEWIGIQLHSLCIINRDEFVSAYVNSLVQAVLKNMKSLSDFKYFDSTKNKDILRFEGGLLLNSLTNLDNELSRVLIACDYLVLDNFDSKVGEQFNLQDLTLICNSIQLEKVSEITSFLSKKKQNILEISIQNKLNDLALLWDFILKSTFACTLDLYFICSSDIKCQELFRLFGELSQIIPRGKNHQFRVYHPDISEIEELKRFCKILMKTRKFDLKIIKSCDAVFVYKRETNKAKYPL